MNLNEKKREIGLFLLSAVVLSILTNLVASYLFEILKIVPFIRILVSVVLIAVLILIYSFAYGNNLNKTVNSTFLYVYSPMKLSFIEIPWSPASVHSRLMYEEQTLAYKKLFMHEILDKYDYKTKFQLINYITQEIILTKVVNTKGHQNDKEISRDDLPKRYLVNPNFFTDKFSTFIPDIAKIDEDTNSLTASVDIVTKYGNVTFGWSISFYNPPSFSGPYINTKYGKDSEQFFDIRVQVHMRCTYKKYYIFSKGIAFFNEWIEDMENNMKQCDWSATEKRIPVLLLNELLDQSSQKRNDIQ